MTWPMYSRACRKDVDDLLRQGGSLSAYRANPQVGVEPQKGSWAWRLERDIERRFRVRHAVLVNSGTAALHAALASLSLRPGEEVVTTPYSFSATVAAIVLSGGTPVFADVDPYTFCITKETVSRVISKRTRAILPVDLFGLLPSLSDLRGFGLPIVEDACQAVGASRDGRFSGTFGIAGAYSFNGTKNVPAGECGALVTDSDEVALRARLLMNHGENFGEKQVGLNYRPNELTACVAWHGLQELDKRNSKRYMLAAAMSGKIIALDSLICPPAVDWSEYEIRHAFYVYPFRLHRGTGRIDREKFCKRMEKKGIPVGRGYIQPTLNRYPAFRKYQRTPLPVVEELSSRTLCILSTLTPDRPLSYSDEVAEAMRRSLR